MDDALGGGDIGSPAAVMVTYNPPEGLEARIRAILDQVERLVIVDNGSLTSPLPEKYATDTRVLYLGNAKNDGIATALNQGLRQLLTSGYKFAVLFDHDSTPKPHMVQRLIAARNNATNPQGIALVAPRILYGHPNIRCRWPRRHVGPFFKFVYADRMKANINVDLAISSGMLIDLFVWKKLKGFDESLFIDLVDTEFCLRVRANNYHVLAEPRAELQHTLGDVAEHKLGPIATYPTNHSDARHYYINRNRIILMKRYAFSFPSWATYEILLGIKLLIKVILFESDRRKKIKATMRGNLDGFKIILRTKLKIT